MELTEPEALAWILHTFFVLPLARKSLKSGIYWSYDTSRNTKPKAFDVDTFYTKKDRIETLAKASRCGTI